MRITEGRLIGTGLNIAIIASRSGDMAASHLIDSTKDTLMRHDVSGSAIDIYKVSGVWELPVIAQEVALTGKYDAIIALGAELPGELLANVALNHRAPVLFGSDGSDCAMRAIETANLLRSIRKQNTTNTTEERIYNA